ncbi:MAG TPA: methyltransferase domain-containing protein [Candidatus Pullichristensenella stercorigallinarum]|uniref:Methyltransferase domain-containing protein n=1 Tax=Candidatus Pullichristensenella stercorigallinarum TaxID=2840909 RepID=A0A9D0ZJB4_9FIRM|nr:methyltransferase domain-containing protein [Candidatus Pullichristensenella stercorigallinarum]
MKENRYDDPIFFEKYSHMPRSEHGLEAAGEWEALQTLLPDFAHKRVLDLGCGYGWHCAYALEHGAAAVTGVDISEKMLAVARKKTGTGNVSYIRAAMEDVDFPDGSFDVVLSSLALHYVASFTDMARKIYRWLAPGGDFVFSIEHPIFTAYGNQDWYRDAEGNILHFPVDNYFFEGVREAVFLGERVTKYHHTLTTVLDGLLACGFTLRRVVEPQPPARMLDMEGMRDELRRPMMLLTAARKA